MRAGKQDDPLVIGFVEGVLVWLRAFGDNDGAQLEQRSHSHDIGVRL